MRMFLAVNSGPCLVGNGLLQGDRVFLEAAHGKLSAPSVPWTALV